jgi:hypothetical protein
MYAELQFMCRKNTRSAPSFVLLLKLFFCALIGYATSFLQYLRLFGVRFRMRYQKEINPLSYILPIFGWVSCRITFSLNMYHVSLKYTSATVAAATDNSLPAVTFFLALLLR